MPSSIFVQAHISSDGGGCQGPSPRARRCREQPADQAAHWSAAFTAAIAIDRPTTAGDWGIFLESQECCRSSVKMSTFLYAGTILGG